MMAYRKLDGINSATVLVANNGELSEITCICCAELELELERTRIELRSTQKIVKLLEEEIYSTELEVMNNTKGLSNKSESKSDSPQYDRKSQIQKPGTQQSETTEERKVKLKDNSGLYSRAGKGNELQSEFKDAANIKDRLDEQFRTLSSKRENIDIFPPAKTIFKHTPMIVNTEVITKNCDNVKTLSRFETRRITKINIHNRRFRGSNEANNHKIMVIGDSHYREYAKIISDYLGGKYVVTGMIKPGAGALDILTLTNSRYRHLTRRDVIIVQAGSNDVYRNNAKLALTQIVNFYEELSNVNIIRYPSQI
jgi:hypothetical protein